MNGLIINGVFYKAVQDNYIDCPDCCDLIGKCNENKGTAPCLLFGEKHHFEKRMPISDKIEHCHTSTSFSEETKDMFNKIADSAYNDK